MDEFSEGHNQDFFQVEYFRALKVSQCCKRSAEVRTRNPTSESINLFLIHANYVVLRATMFISGK